jgi:hypothetical protein
VDVLGSLARLEAAAGGGRWEAPRAFAGVVLPLCQRYNAVGISLYYILAAPFALAGA